MCDLCIFGVVIWCAGLFVTLRDMGRSHRVFQEFLAAILNKNVLVSVFAALGIQTSVGEHLAAVPYPFWLKPVTL